MSFSENLLILETGSGSSVRYGLFDIQKKTIILPVEYYWETYNPVNRIIVSKGEDEERLYGMINRQGQWLLPLEYGYLSHRSRDNYIVAKKDNKYGLIDTTGHSIIPFSYDHMRVLNDCPRCGNLPKDQFIVATGDKYGIVNLENKILVPLTLPQFGSTNTALVNESFERCIFFDLNGNVLSTAEFHVTGFRGGLIEGRTNDNRPVTADLYGHTVIGN